MKANLDIVLDCSDPQRLAEFWCAALNYRVLGSAGAYAALVPKDGVHPPLVLQRVPEPKVAKNRMHVDIITDDIEREADRLEGLGASRLPPKVREEHETRWVTMADPEGNEFCVCPGIEWMPGWEGDGSVEVGLEVPAPVALFLDGIETGRWSGMEECLAPDVLYDASVPGWHYQYQGAARVTQEYREEWTGKHTWQVVERHVSPTAEGVVLDLEARGTCPGDANHAPHEEAIRIANIFRLSEGRIIEHRFYCCGEWDEQTIRRIEAEAPKAQAGPRDVKGIHKQAAVKMDDAAANVERRGR